MHVIAAKAVCFKEALEPEFKSYMERVLKNTKVLGEELTKYGFRMVSGGTDNHLLLVDLTNKDISGKDAEKLLDSVGITVNKNTIPSETRSPFVTSGIRIGTAAATTRGFNEDDFREVARFINYVIEHKDEDLSKIRQEVIALCDKYPLY